uniref:Putative c2h2-type zn-finger protein n=1 Tax=Culex tarsalis TaxID=7177 RepID=A0A1Q3F5B9_CULTA
MDTNCRTCARRDEFQGVSVNSISDSHQEPIYLMLIYCTQLQFSTNDTFPQQICPECLVLLDGAFTFWKQCRQTDANFRFGVRSADLGEGVASIKMVALPETVTETYHCCIPKCSKVAPSLVELEEHAKEEHFLKRRGFELRRSRHHAHICSVCLAGFETMPSWEMHQMLLHGVGTKISELDTLGGGNESSDSDEWPEQEPVEESFEQEESNFGEVEAAGDFTGESGKKKRKIIPRGGSQVLYCNGCSYQSNKKYNMARHQQIRGHKGVTYSKAVAVEPASDSEEAEAARSDSNLIQFVEVPVKIEPTLNEADITEEEQQSIEESPQHQCAYCGMVLYSKAKKLRHLQFNCMVLHKPKKATSKQCPKCNKKFNSSGLSRHLLFCSLGVTRKECPNCNRAFNKSSNLNRHINLGYCMRKKFQCKFCLAWYGKNAALTRHLNNGCPMAATVETVEPPKRSDSPCRGRVECPHCYSRFSRLGNLNRHIKENCHVLLKKREIEQQQQRQEVTMEQDSVAMDESAETAETEAGACSET